MVRCPATCCRCLLSDGEWLNREADSLQTADKQSRGLAVEVVRRRPQYCKLVTGGVILAEPMRIRVGLAGWSNPPAVKSGRNPDQTHLSFYAAHFSCVEINSSFYRPHHGATYARWRDETPAAFRFSVKMPRSVTHESHLKRCATEVAGFYDAIAALQPKLAAVLVQLPPGLEFNKRTVRAFFNSVPRPRGVKLVCEPRHPSWFTSTAENTLQDARVSRVGADPARGPGAGVAAGARRFAYFRWHGSPRMYYSKYSAAQLADFAATIRKAKALETWCVFDNTAQYAAWDDALQFKAALVKGGYSAGCV
jgi:uncharacterized protein YecE (DUF72 family)